jgi:nitroreductase
MTLRQNDPYIPVRAQNPDPADTVMAYHRRTMHRLDGYARGPGTLDWDAQPDPWRTWRNTSSLRLPLVSDGVAAPYAALTGQAPVTPAPLTVVSVAALMELSFGLSAWKEIGPDRWLLRCNPSSGNLHPTEAYVLARDIPGLADGVHHYDSRSHALAHRCSTSLTGGRLWIGLSSIHWREAWKYGERALRYCALDIGHAIGALEAAAAALGWRPILLDPLDSAGVARLLGTDRAEDFGGVEREEAELILAIDTNPPAGAPVHPPEPGSTARWHGTANLLDPHPMCRWPAIAEVADASRAGSAHGGIAAGTRTPSSPAPAARAASIILNRRSAQRYDRNYTMPLECFARILDAARPGPSSSLDLIIFVHSIEGVAPGLYALPRDDADGQANLRSALDPAFLWEPLAALGDVVPLRSLVLTDSRKVIRALTCHQAIAADACMTLCLLSDFARPIAANPWNYRALHWQAGRLGQRLYLEAEAAGLSGTGIGCFLDDEIHRLLGIETADRQALYHFAIGRGLADTRIATVTAYGQRDRSEAPIWP